MQTFFDRLHAPAQIGRKAAELGNLPEWNLADLYAGMNAPELKRDIDRRQARRGAEIL